MLKLKILIFAMVLLMGCSSDSDKEISLNSKKLSDIYRKNNITDIEMRYVGPEHDRNGYKLSLYPSGNIKDSIIIRGEDDPRGSGTTVQTFYESGKEWMYKSESRYKQGSRFITVYKFEGKSYDISESVEESVKDEEGNYLNSKIKYNGTHEFETKYSYTDSSRTVIEYGPIGDIMSHETYFFDTMGNDFKLRDNLLGKFIEINDISIQDTISMNGVKFEINIYDYSDSYLLNGCYVIMVDQISEFERVILRMDCNRGTSLEEVKNGLLNNDPIFIRKSKEVRIEDKNGNWIQTVSLGPTDSDTAMFSRRELMYNEDKTIHQANHYNSMNSPTRRVVYSYDDQKRVATEKRILLDDNKIRITEYIYDNRGLLIEEKRINDGVWTGSNKYTYK